MSAYLKINGFNGGVTASNHEDSIALHHMSFEINRANHLRIGQAQRRMPGAPSLSAVQISKQLDNTSNDFIEHALTGEIIDEAKITLCRTDTEQTAYAEYTLTNVLVTHIQNDYSGEQHPMETIELSFTKLQSDYFGSDETGQSQSPNRLGYDLATAEIL